MLFSCNYEQILRIRNVSSQQRQQGAAAEQQQYQKTRATFRVSCSFAICAGAKQLKCPKRYTCCCRPFHYLSFYLFSLSQYVYISIFLSLSRSASIYIF